MGKHLVICGHGQGRTGYDPGAVNAKLGITEADRKSTRLNSSHP